MLYHCFASIKQLLLDFFKLLDSRVATHTHKRRSDWNSGGTHGGTYYKSPAIEAKNTFSYIVMQVIWCLKFCEMTKSGGQSPAPNSGGKDLSPVPSVIYAHAHTYAIVWLYKSYNQWGSPMTSGLLGDRSEKAKLRRLDYVAYKCVSALFYWKTKLLSAMCLVAINILLRW